MINQKTKVILFRSIERADKYAENLAENGQCLNIICTTPSNYIRDLLKKSDIELSIIDEATRYAFLISIVDAIGNEEYRHYFSTCGAIKFLNDLAKTLAGTKTVDYVYDLITTPDQDYLVGLESFAMRIVIQYYKSTAALGLAEIGDVAAKLATKNVCCDEIIVHDNMDFQQSVFDFLVSCDAKFLCDSKQFEAMYKSDFESKNLKVNILTGVRARNRVLPETVKSHKDKNILISSADPDLIFDELKHFFDEDEVQINLKSKVNFSQTSFGQALTEAYLIISENAQDPTPLCDFAQNPFSKMSTYQTLQYDKQMRSKPYRGGNKEIDNLISKSPCAQNFLKLFSDDGSSIDEILQEIYSQVVKDDTMFSGAKKELELSTIATVRRLCSTLYGLGIRKTLNPLLISQFGFSNNKTFGSKDAKTIITIVGTSAVSSEPDELYDISIACDVSTCAFNAAEDLDALNTLCKKLDIKKRLTAKDIARENFSSVSRVSKDEVVLMLPLRDADLQETFPSFPLQEMFSITSNKTKDLESTLISAGVEVEYAGEEEVVRTSALSEADAGDFRTSKITLWKHALNNKENFRKYIEFETHHGAHLPVLSPSDIESYISCPLKWLYDRKFRAEEIGYEFSALDKGIIAHDTFNMFYSELKDKGISRLNENNIDEYDKLLCDCFDRSYTARMQSSENSEFENASNIFLESSQRIALLGDIRHSIKLHSQMPESLVVSQCEYDFSCQDLPVYANSFLRGRVDRIDEDLENNGFLVIDYKGSIANFDVGKYELDESGVPQVVQLSNRIQGLIYASCYARITGEKPLGALFMTYRQKPNDSVFLCGHISKDIADSLVFCKGTAEKHSKPAGEQNEEKQQRIEDECIINCNFDDYLAATERAIEPYIEKMIDGNIEADVKNASICRWCDVPDCERRR